MQPTLFHDKGSNRMQRCYCKGRVNRKREDSEDRRKRSPWSEIHLLSPTRNLGARGIDRWTERAWMKSGIRRIATLRAAIWLLVELGVHTRQPFAMSFSYLRMLSNPYPHVNASILILLRLSSPAHIRGQPPSNLSPASLVSYFATLFYMRLLNNRRLSFHVRRLIAFPRQRIFSIGQRPHPVDRTRLICGRDHLDRRGFQKERKERTCLSKEKETGRILQSSG